MYDFFEDHGISMEARVSLVLNVFMYVDDCINIEAYKSEHGGKCPTLPSRIIRKKYWIKQVISVLLMT